MNSRSHEIIAELNEMAYSNTSYDRYNDGWNNLRFRMYIAAKLDAYEKALASLEKELKFAKAVQAALGEVVADTLQQIANKLPEKK